MLKTLEPFLVFAGLVAVYIVWARPYLLALPQFAELRQAEFGWWATVKQWLLGRRTILIGFIGEIVAFGPDLLQVISGFDLKLLFGVGDSWAARVNAVVALLMLIFRVKASSG